MGRVVEEGFTFDDVLMRPGRSSIEPADAEIRTALARGFFISLPFLSAAMDTVTDARFAIALGKLGGLGIIHRNQTTKEQCTMVHKAKQADIRVGAACGPFDFKRAMELERAGVDMVVIDCAHGHNSKVLKSARTIKKRLCRAKMIVGNIATAEAAREACTFADAVKVGVGPGSICTTRVVSGVGVPQLSAIMAVAKVTRRHRIPLVADGGMRTSGDIAKALAAGASAVMLGNLFAGTREAPGRVIIKSEKKFKYYRGMGSAPALANAEASDRYLTGGKNMIPEGVEGLVPYRGTLQDTVRELEAGVRIAMGYVGAKNISELQRYATFVRITPASYAESKPHSLNLIQ